MITGVERSEVIAWSRLIWWKARRKIYVIVEKFEEKEKFDIAVARR